MKGIIFNLLEQAVVDEHGPTVWEALLGDTGLDGAWTSVGSYPDDDLLALVSAGARRLDVDQQALIRWFGHTALPLLAQRYGAFFDGHSSLATFLPTLNDVIHAEVRKLYPDAVVPTFDFLEVSSESVVMAYTSPRHLCALAEGFIEGAADHFGETATIDQRACMVRGDERCVIAVSISG